MKPNRQAHDSVAVIPAPPALAELNKLARRDLYASVLRRRRRALRRVAGADISALVDALNHFGDLLWAAPLGSRLLTPLDTQLLTAAEIVAVPAFAGLARKLARGRRLVVAVFQDHTLVATACPLKASDPPGWWLAKEHALAQAAPELDAFLGSNYGRD